MLGIAHTCGIVCMVFCKMIIGLGNYRKYIQCILVLVGFMDLSVHSIVDHNVTKSKKSYIKSMAQPI
jgi:hypothetical protein